MSHARSARPRRLALLTAAALGLGGCGPFDVREAAGHLPPYQRTVDRPGNFIDAALDHCPDKTEERERTCVKQALSERRVSVAALAALVPGCRAGRLCAYHHTSEDRLGYVAATAEDFIARWTVGFDLRKAAGLAADVPITVEVD